VVTLFLHDALPILSHVVGFQPGGGCPASRFEFCALAGPVYRFSRRPVLGLASDGCGSLFPEVPVIAINTNPLPPPLLAKRKINSSFWGWKSARRQRVSRRRGGADLPLPCPSFKKRRGSG